MGEPIPIGSIVKNFVPQSIRPASARPRSGAMAKVLADEWPCVYAACIKGYFARVNFVLVNERNQCDAGYMLSACLMAKRIYEDNFAHRPLSRAALDVVFAHEISYHWDRNHHFDNPKAALYKCLCNLVVERPEKFR